MLSRAVILDAALQVASQEGLSGLSQRKLAAELGVSPMAMYRHFRDKQTLLNALLDHVIDPDALLADLGTDLEEGLVSSFRALRQLFLTYPMLAPLAGTPASVGPRALEFLERLLAWMNARGLPSESAALRLQGALGYTLGAASIAAAAASSNAVDSARARFADLDLAAHPHLVLAAPALLTFVSDERFEETLRQILRAVI